MGRVEAAGLFGILGGEGRKAGVRLGDVGGQDDGGSEAGELGVKGGKFGLGNGGSLPSDEGRNGGDTSPCSACFRQFIWSLRQWASIQPWNRQRLPLRVWIQPSVLRQPWA